MLIKTIDFNLFLQDQKQFLENDCENQIKKSTSIASGSFDAFKIKARKVNHQKFHSSGLEPSSRPGCGANYTRIPKCTA